LEIDEKSRYHVHKGPVHARDNDLSVIGFGLQSRLLSVTV